MCQFVRTLDSSILKCTQCGLSAKAAVLLPECKEQAQRALNLFNRQDISGQTRG